MLSREGPEGKIIDSNNPIRIVFVGAPDTGKSCLIRTAETGKFLEGASSVPECPTIISSQIFEYDAPSRVWEVSTLWSADEVNSDALELSQVFGKIDDLTQAQVFVATYSYDHPETFRHLEISVLPTLQKFFNKVLVVVVGLKSDLFDGDVKDTLFGQDFEASCYLLMHTFSNVEALIPCSSKKFEDVKEVFRGALRAFLYPMFPLMFEEERMLSPRLVNALRRIFYEAVDFGDVKPRDSLDLILDPNTSMSLHQYHNIQAKRGVPPLKDSEFQKMKETLEWLSNEGVLEGGITLSGFILLHSLYLEQKGPEIAWTTVGAFGYDYNLKQTAIRHQSCFTKLPDQSVELTDDCRYFLESYFKWNHPDETTQVLPAATVSDLFETEMGLIRCRDEIAMTTSGELSLEGFMSMWDLMAIREPARTFATLIDVRYLGSPESALRITRSRQLDRKEQKSERNVFQCFVFGAKKAGKSSLLNCFLGRSFSASCTSSPTELYAADVVHEKRGGTNKTLILQEVPDDKVETLLPTEEFLPACDVAIFVYNSSDKISWERAMELLIKVVGRGKENGFGVPPCLFVAVKKDTAKTVTSSILVSWEIGLRKPMVFDPKSLDGDGIFLKIVKAAEQPDLNIPYLYFITGIMDEDGGSSSTRSGC